VLDVTRGDGEVCVVLDRGRRAWHQSARRAAWVVRAVRMGARVNGHEEERVALEA
jgi:hypothetical protein